jgi:hypothetical protein
VSAIADDLRHALDVADARLKGGDPHNLARRVEETRELLASVVLSVIALDHRIDQIAD